MKCKQQRKDIVKKIIRDKKIIREYFIVYISISIPIGQ